MDWCSVCKYNPPNYSSHEPDKPCGDCWVYGEGNEPSKLVRTDNRQTWYCDPNKNSGCNKSGCFILGGPCKLTFDEEFAVVVCGKAIEGPMLYGAAGIESTDGK